MIVECPTCRWTYDDEFRWTMCPHPTFPANDGQNNHEHHPESHIAPPDQWFDVEPMAVRCKCGARRGREDWG